MLVPNFSAFVGEHCETTAVGNLLKHSDLELSEPMLFGLGGGLGFIYWKMKTMPLPFLGGRTKDLTQNLCSNLGLNLVEHETASLKKAWEQVGATLDAGRPIGLQLDCHHLDYFSNKIHFAGHHVAMHGFDESFAYLVDTRQQGGMVRTTIENLALARNEKGPMARRNRSYVIEGDFDEGQLMAAIPRAIRANAHEFLNPPIKNLGFKGILKSSVEIKKWLKESQNPEADFSQTAMLMEKAGTGGALFRNMYRDFLGEAFEVSRLEALHAAKEDFSVIAKKWTEVSQLFDSVTGIEDSDVVAEASEILAAIANAEKVTVSNLDSALAKQMEEPAFGL